MGTAIACTAPVSGRLCYLSGRGIIDRWLSGRDEALQQNSAAPARCERQRNGSRGDRLVTSNTAGDGRGAGLNRSSEQSYLTAALNKSHDFILVSAAASD